MRRPWRTHVRWMAVVLGLGGLAGGYGLWAQAESGAGDVQSRPRAPGSAAGAEGPARGRPDAPQSSALYPRPGPGLNLLALGSETLEQLALLNPGRPVRLSSTMRVSRTPRSISRTAAFASRP